MVEKIQPLLPDPPLCLKSPADVPSLPRAPYRQWSGHGINLSGGFAEYVAYPHGKVFKIHNMSDIDATLIEPASCACHGLDKIKPRLGSSVLMFGAGPTGLVMPPLRGVT